MRYSQQMQTARKQIVSSCRCAFVALVVCALFTACGLLSAQTGGTGAISGEVTDPTGAMVVAAQVKVTDVATGYARISQSNDHGMYQSHCFRQGNTRSKSRNRGLRRPRRRTCG
jgi:hypothetical protein